MTGGIIDVNGASYLRSWFKSDTVGSGHRSSTARWLQRSSMPKPSVDAQSLWGKRHWTCPH